jgi:hypothetical protein
MDVAVAMGYAQRAKQRAIAEGRAVPQPKPLRAPERRLPSGLDRMALLAMFGPTKFHDEFHKRMTARFRDARKVGE